MDRLTGIDELGYYAPRNETLYCLKQRGEITDRLAAYEATGLTPEEIRVMLKKIDDLHRLVKKIDTKKLENLSYLVDAEEQGRLIVLPCKVGNTVYTIEVFFEGGEWKKRIRDRKFNVSDVEKRGKWVFLSREEAEAALEGR